MPVNLSAALSANIFKVPKKILPFVATGLLITSALTGCDRFEKAQKERSEQETFIKCEQISNDSMFVVKKYEQRYDSVTKCDMDGTLYSMPPLKAKLLCK